MNNVQLRSEGQMTSTQPSIPKFTTSFRYRAYVLALLILVHSISWVDRTLIGVLAPLIKADLQLTDAQLGLVSGTAFAIAFVLFAIPIGWLADRHSRARIIALAVAFWSICTSLFGMAGTMFQLLAARAGVGLGESGSGAAAMSLITDYFPPAQRARALSIYCFGISLGVAAAAVVGGPVSSLVGWRMTLILAGALGLIVALLVTLTLKEPIRVTRAGESASPQPLFASMGSMLRKPGYVCVCLATSLATIVGTSSAFWVPSYLVRSFGLDVVSAALAYGSVQFVSGISGAWVGGYVSDRIQRTHPAAPAIVTGCVYLVSAPLLAGMFMAPSAFAAVCCFFFAAFFKSAGQGTAASAVQYFATATLRGTAASMLNVITILVGLGLGMPLIGALSDWLRPSFADDSLRYALLLALPLICLAATAASFAATRWMKVPEDEQAERGLAFSG